MSNTISLKELERKAYRSFFGDGIWDIYLGLLLLSMGGGPILMGAGAAPSTAMVLSLSLGVAAVALFLGGKRLITIPRLGRVKFGEARGKGTKRTRAVMALSVLVGLAVFVLMSAKRLPIGGPGGIPVAALIWAGNCVVVFGLAAYFLDFSRLYAYGLLYAASFSLGVVLTEQLGRQYGFLVAYGATAGPMLVIGVALLSRFLRAYPAGEVRDDSANG